jgi:ribosomal protein L11 methyltransferase
MNLEYYAVTFQMDAFDHEIWLALLSEWPFEAFHDDAGTITGYILDHDVTPDLMHYLDKNVGIHFTDYTLEKVPDQNWNQVWESSFNPVTVDDYCYIRAKFHPERDTFKHSITISPRMAFGTGHHATTYMMLQAMSTLDFKGKKVLDFGCGTGILAIVAAKEGAAKVIGVDIQPEAIENSIEHAAMNEVTQVCNFYEGGLLKGKDEIYDIILANITRNIILQHLIALTSMLSQRGHLLLSGIMFDDVEIIRLALSKLDFEIISSNEKDQWVQMTCKLKM